MQCHLKCVFLCAFFVTGIRTEQDLYVRLIDSMTKQVGEYIYKMMLDSVTFFTSLVVLVKCNTPRSGEVMRSSDEP